VLCDVPCSGDGALRKAPLDLPQWQPSPALAEHPRQLAILMRGLELLAPGGTLEQALNLSAFAFLLCMCIPLTLYILYIS
jgi:hypothetical protein